MSPDFVVFSSAVSSPGKKMAVCGRRALPVVKVDAHRRPSSYASCLAPGALTCPAKRLRGVRVDVAAHHHGGRNELQKRRFIARADELEFECQNSDDDAFILGGNRQRKEEAQRTAVCTRRLSRLFSLNPGPSLAGPGTWGSGLLLLLELV